MWNNMTSSVNPQSNIGLSIQLLCAGLEGVNEIGVINWNDIERLNDHVKKGVYIITLDNPLENPPFLIEEDADWLPDAKFDNMALTLDEMMTRLRRFWNSDEIILYIGQTDREINERLKEFKKQKIGKNVTKKHAGGIWIKLLDPDKLRVYRIENNDPPELEMILLNRFIKYAISKSDDGKKPILPFANLEYKKIHGISLPFKHKKKSVKK